MPTAYEVLERFPYGKKRLQEALTARDVGRVIIKKRGFPQEPDEIRKQLKLRGSQEMIVVLARIGKGPRGISLPTCAGNRPRAVQLTVPVTDPERSCH